MESKSVWNKFPEVAPPLGKKVIVYVQEGDSGHYEIESYDGTGWGCEMDGYIVPEPMLWCEIPPFEPGDVKGSPAH